MMKMRTKKTKRRMRGNGRIEEDEEDKELADWLAGQKGTGPDLDKK